MNENRLHPPAQSLDYLTKMSVLLAGILLVAPRAGAQSTFSLHKSTDHGASWSRVGQGLPTGARINALGMAGATVVAGTDRGMFVSMDAGATWSRPLAGVATESRVLSFATAAAQAFAGTEKHGVLVSGDQGSTWQEMNHGLGDLYVRSLLTLGTKVYAGTDGAGVFVSENAGASWTSQRSGLPESSQVFDLASVGGTLFAALYSKGLYRWNEKRMLWEKSGEVVPLALATAGQSLVGGHNPGGVFVSSDSGATWQNGNLGLPVNAPVWTLAAHDERVWVGTTGRVGLAP